jgi:hypothetical protein
VRAALAALAAATGCLGPQVSDTPAPSGDIVPAGTVIPPIDNDEIAAHDGVDGVVPRLSAFAAGAPTHVWDFGAAPMFAAPLFVMMTRQPDGTLAPLAHPPIAGAVPGDPDYSPFWQVFALVVTDRYAGQLITSSTAIEEAVRDGLIEAPAVQSYAVDYPMVASDVTLDVGTGAPLAPAGRIFYEHETVAYFDFGQLAIADHVNVAVAARYVLAREGQEPLSEPIRHVDIDGDGDVLDTNDVFERAAADPLRSPLCRTIDVVVADSVTSIDTSQNDAIAQLQDATQLFDPMPVAGTVVAYQSTDELHNIPAQRTPGGL